MTKPQPNVNRDYWKILLVDDDNFVHVMIKELMKNFKFENRPFEILSAHSSIEALNILSNNGDIAIVLLDIFVEKEDSGLKLVKYIREVIGNLATRIILMTSKGSETLEEKAILNYDINGYEEKNQLLSKKLYNTIVSALRSYRDIVHINNNKKRIDPLILDKNSLILPIS